MKKVPLILLWSLLLLQMTLRAQELRQWRFRMSGAAAWDTAQVPGTVHLDLLRIGRIPEPYADTHELQLQWISDSTWEYESRFTVSDSLLKMERQELVFEGIDTYALIYLNGKKVFVADNMFRSWRIPVKGLLQQNNTLLVVFPPIESYARQFAARHQYRLPEGLRSYVRKAQYHFGWDWGPRLLTAGLWKPVSLECAGATPTQLEQLRIEVTAVADSSAKGNALVTLSSDRRRKVSLLLTAPEAGLNLMHEIALQKGRQIVRIPFTVKAIRTWEPNLRGGQTLYSFQCGLADDRTQTKSTRTAFRTVTLLREPDSIGRSFGFEVNGKAFFARGANVIPPEMLVHRFSDTDYLRLVQQAHDANCNMLRVWGGGLYLPESFYNACDSLGILVWQDFMFACSMVPGDSDFVDNVRREAIEQIERLSAHPCLALWCGNNENEEGWKNWGWQKQMGYSPQDSARIYRDYLNLFETVLPALVDSLDPTRSYRPTSPQFGWGRAESMKEGDSHYWGVWWGMEPFEKYREKTGRFMSEYGFQSAPALSTWKNYLSEPDLQAPAFRHHQKHPRGFETIDEYTLRYFRKATDIESFTYTSQLVQAYGMKMAIDAHRRSWPRCRGSLFWQWNDCWPVISWSAVDYSGQEKILYHTARKAFEPLYISIQEEKNNIDVFVQNDGAGYRSVTVRVYYLRTDTVSTPVLLEERYLKLPADTAIHHALVIRNEVLRRLSKENVVFVAEAEDNFLFKVVYRDFLFRCLPRELVLEAPDLELQQEGDEIRIKSRNFIYGLYLWSDTGPVRFSDNGLHLLPGEVRSIQMKGKPGKIHWNCLNPLAPPAKGK